MSRTKIQHTLLRLLYKLLIFGAIIQQNYGNPTASNMPTITPPFEVDLSSPVPFTTRKPEISITEDTDFNNKNNNDNDKTIEILDASATLKESSSTTLKPQIETNLNDFKNLKELNLNNNNSNISQNTNNNNNNDNSNNNAANNDNNYDDEGGDDDYLETDLKVEKTTQTSMEQQDDPVIPPTTITFSNVAAAGILGNSNSNIDGVVMGNSGSDNGNGNSNGVNYNDAMPPYAAVDTKYGKIIKFF